MIGYVRPFGNLGYWTNGGSVRIPGRSGFESKNAYFVKQYVKKVKETAKNILNKQLPQAVRSFIDTQLTVGTIPWDTGNLHDSFVGAVAYKDSKGTVRLTNGGQAIRARKMAYKMQHWSLDFGGLDQHNRGNYYSGYGHVYSQDYAESIKDKEDGVGTMGYDVAVYLEATVPYAYYLNESSKQCAGWFDDIATAFASRIRTEANIAADTVASMDIFGDTDTISGFGVMANIGF
jgi:hypothetical protein